MTALPALVSIRQLSEYHRETIPEDYLDEMGHMNVRWYIALFSRAVGGLFTELGMPPEYFTRGIDGSFALTQFVRYLAEVHVGQTIAIHTRVIARTKKRIHFLHFMVNQTTEKLAATLESCVAHADLEKRKMSPFPEEVAGSIDALIEKHDALAWEAPVSGAVHA